MMHRGMLCNTPYYYKKSFDFISPCAGFEEERRSCRDISCGQNAVCELRGDEPYCACKLGFTGDGYNCQPIGQCSDKMMLKHV